MLLSLAAIWGSSYVLQVLALRDMAPAVVVSSRLALCALALVALHAAQGRVGATARQLHAVRGPLAVLGFVATAAPMLLVAWGQLHIDSGMIALLTASTPLFVAVMAFAVVHSERVTGMRLVGVGVGFAGVVMLIGTDPRSEPDALLGAIAGVTAASLYAGGALFTSSRLAHVPADVLTIGASTWGAVFLVPLVAARPPAAVPGWPAIAGLVGLALPASALGFVLYYALVTKAGASRAMLVSYLVPGVALVFGAITLGEELSVLRAAGLVLVLAGVALGSGKREPRAPNAVAPGAELAATMPRGR